MRLIDGKSVPELIMGDIYTKDAVDIIRMQAQADAYRSALMLFDLVSTEDYKDTLLSGIRRLNDKIGELRGDGDGVDE